MLLKNAKNTVEQSKLTMQLASTSSIKIETLESTWETICNGIVETQQIQENARVKRIDDQKRLEQIRQDYEAKFYSKK